MWQLSRQYKSRQKVGRQFLLKQITSRLEKKRSQSNRNPGPFAIPGFFVTSRLSVQDTQKKLISL